MQLTFYNYDWSNPIRKRIKGVLKTYNPLTNEFIQTLRSSKYKEWVTAGKPLFKAYIPALLSETGLVRRLKIYKILESINQLPSGFENITIANVKLHELHFIFYYIYHFGYRKDKDGYVQVYANSLKKYLGKHYNRPLQTLFNWGLIQTPTGSFNNGYHNGKDTKGHSRGFRITPSLLPEHGRKLKTLPPYNSIYLQLKLYNKAYRNRKNLKIGQTHEMLAAMADQILIHEEAFLKDVELYPKKYEEKKVDLALLRIERINNGITIKEDEDLFGERFFCDLSNLLGYARKYAHLGDFKYFLSLDIKNSQFYFLSQLCNEAVIDEYLIKRERDPILKRNFRRFKEDLQQLKDEPDFKLMLLRISNGTLYDHLADKLGISRNSAKKDYFFKGAFSEKDINMRVKKKIQKYYPSFIKLIELTNCYSTPKLLPQILQKVESRILLDEVAVDLFNVLNPNRNITNPFFTVHDAFYVYPESYELAKDTILRSFTTLGFDHPKIG